MQMPSPRRAQNSPQCLKRSLHYTSSILKVAVLAEFAFYHLPGCIVTWEGTERSVDIHVVAPFHKFECSRSKEAKTLNEQWKAVLTSCRYRHAYAIVLPSIEQLAARSSPSEICSRLSDFVIPFGTFRDNVSVWFEIRC